MTGMIMSILFAVLPAPSCPCSYNFIGNGCCSYGFDCLPYGLGAPLVTQDETEELSVCVQYVRNCTPCTTTHGGCSGTITYTDSATTTTAGAVQIDLNNALKGMLGGTFNVSAEFSAGQASSSSVSISIQYSCTSSPPPCQSFRLEQKLQQRTISIEAPLFSRTYFRTHGLSPGASGACLEHPEDCPVDNQWQLVGEQSETCQTGTVGGSGTDQIHGVCTVEPAGGCGSNCSPCLPGLSGIDVNYNEAVQQ